MTDKKHLPQRIREFLRADEGVSALEYAIVVGVVVVGVGVEAFTGVIQTALTNIGADVATTTNTLPSGNINPN